METTVTVIAVEDVGSNTITIEFESPAEFTAEPGQFVKLTGTVDGESYSRFYTLSSPDTVSTFETTIETDPDEGGPFSAHLAGLTAGDTLEMNGPFGSDHYEGEARSVVLAGGPGIGPAIGIGERALEDDNEVAVVYRDETPAHRARLDTLAENGATVRVIDDPDDDLTEAVEDVLTGEDGEQVFVYGFAEFVETAQAALIEAGADVEAAKVENFG